MKNEIKKIPFDNGELLGVKTEDGKVWLGIKKACLDIGLNENQADNEIKKIKVGLLFNGEWKDLNVKFDGQGRNTIVLNEEFVPMWLAQINLTPNMKKKNENAVHKLLKYQLEASKTLKQAFTETEEQKQEFYNDLGIHGDIVDLKQKVSSMEETMNKLIDATTINTRQQQRLYRIAKDRINKLLGGAHSDNYKLYGRSYFINMWNDFKECFATGSYKDLNPIQFNAAIDYIKSWSYSGESFA